ncbi:MAG TPA: hypothetical protein VKQ08_04545 [Cyclobacteriaceae bacterium]|nr:hypothetical protein [Cyclobacteriaceae bacterium]
MKHLHFEKSFTVRLTPEQHKEINRNVDAELKNKEVAKKMEKKNPDTDPSKWSVDAGGFVSRNRP